MYTLMCSYVHISSVWYLYVMRVYSASLYVLYAHMHGW